MTREPTYRTDLYRGTAPYYDRYRLPYPPELLDDLRQRAAIGDGGRLLDLACGTGQIAFALAGYFGEVWAVDQEAESVAFGRAKAEALGTGNIRWVEASAEELAVDDAFDLVAVGNAFHRLRRDVVAARVVSWLAPGRWLALLGGDTPWRGDRRWQVEMASVLDEWMNRVGATDRVPPGWEEALDRDPNAQVLERAGLDYVGEFAFAVEHDWTVETLAGFVSSTSFLNRDVLGNQVEAFEADLEARLLACEPAGMFGQTLRFAYELAGRPA